MKVVVIGGTGLIGSKLINKLKASGHDAVAASPSTGVNTLTGEGLAEVLQGADVVVDVSNSPSFEDKAVLEFFENSTRKILAAEKNAGVGYHIALSIVGVDLLPDSGYFRAKVAQENLIKASKVPYTIVRATQFFEFLKGIAESNTKGQTVQLPPAFIQPIAAEDVAEALFQTVLKKPINGITEIAGPERFLFVEIITKYLKAINDPRTVVSDAKAGYFGAQLSESSLVPQGKAHLGSVTFNTWFKLTKSQ